MTLHAKKAWPQASVNTSVMLSQSYIWTDSSNDARIATVEELMRAMDTQQFRIITISFLRTRNEKMEKEQGAEMD